MRICLNDFQGRISGLNEHLACDRIHFLPVILRFEEVPVAIHGYLKTAMACECLHRFAA
jgi:hypothetical protein